VSRINAPESIDETQEGLVKAMGTSFGTISFRALEMGTFVANRVERRLAVRYPLSRQALNSRLLEIAFVLFHDCLGPTAVLSEDRFNPHVQFLCNAPSQTTSTDCVYGAKAACNVLILSGKKGFMKEATILSRLERMYRK
jgi:hypothetical protein